MSDAGISSAEKFKAAGLKQRVITALLLALVLLLSILFSSLMWFEILMGILFLAATWEWADLSDCGEVPVRLIYVLAMAACLFLLRQDLFAFSDEVNVTTLFQLMLTALCFWALVLLWVLTYPRTVGLWGSRQVRLLMGFLLVLPAWCGLIFLKQQDASGWLILWILAIVAVADIGAYFVGVRFGAHKLAPRVSPGKTWEGVLGGVLGNFLFAVLLGMYLGASAKETFQLIWVMGLVGGLSVVGDLFESMVKRHRGVKDSGSLLPGHGGILDRIDGWTVAIPVFVIMYLMEAAPF